MNYDDQNVFARIIRGELPCHKVYEDEHVLSFVDLMPQSEGHTLVLPKESAAVLADLSPQALQHTIVATRKIACAVQKAVNAPGFMLAQFNGAEAGQTVPHVHFHIIPRFPGVELKLHSRDAEDADKLKALAERIIAELAK